MPLAECLDTDSMKKFHFLFKVDESVYSRGENFTALTPIDALQQFIDKYPDAVFLGMFCTEEIGHMSYPKSS